MSVLLEGIIKNGKDDELFWSGNWHFAKEKKSCMQFTYKRLSNEITQDLLNFVSFLPSSFDSQITHVLNNTTGTTTEANRGRRLGGYSKSKSKGPKSKSKCIRTKLDATQIIARPDFEAELQNTIAPDQQLMEEGIDKEGLSIQSNNTVFTKNNELLIVSNDKNDIHNGQVGDGNDAGEIENIYSNNNDDEEEEEGGEAEDEESVEVHNSNMSMEDVDDVDGDNHLSLRREGHALELEPGRPEGHQTIESEHASAEAYNLNIADNNNEVGNLQENSIPKSIATPVIINVTHPLLGYWEGSFSIKVYGVDTPVQEEFFFHTVQGRNCDPIAPVASAFDCLPVVTMWTPSLLRRGSSSKAGGSGGEPQYTTVSGFGRNRFGRFAVLGLYDSFTGTLRCERKYVTCRNPGKRGRRASVANTSDFDNNATSSAGLEETTGAATGETETEGQPYKRSRRMSFAPVRGHGHAAASGALESTSTTTASVSETSKSYPTTLIDSASGRGTASTKGSTASHTVGGQSLTSNEQNAESRDHSFETSASGAAGMGQSVKGAREEDLDSEEQDTEHYRMAHVDPTTGDIYEGGWESGARQGMGVCLYVDGTMYQGTWHRGKEHGVGQLLTHDRQVIYSGEWLDGRFNGRGTYHFSNGDEYTGDWREGQRHGTGDYLLKSGCRYVGDWRENKRHGKGVFTWPDGSSYNGDWEEDSRHGRGDLALSNGLRYDGSWVANTMEGRGNVSFADGQEYHGMFKSGKREGRGSVLFAEGAVYEGRFKDDHIDGQGTLKISKIVPGLEPGERLIPLEIQTDMRRVHYKAGFGEDLLH